MVCVGRGKLISDTALLCQTVRQQAERQYAGQSSRRSICHQTHRHLHDTKRKFNAQPPVQDVLYLFKQSGDAITVQVICDKHTRACTTPTAGKSWDF